MRETPEFREQIGRIEELVQNIDSTADPALRATARELVQSVMDLHSAAFERVLEIVTKAGGREQPWFGRLARMHWSAVCSSSMICTRKISLLASTAGSKGRRKS
jgi:hypothetical protein